MFDDQNHRDRVRNSLNSVISQSKGRFTQFMNQGNPNDICYFYLGIIKDFPDWFKFGITNDFNNRHHMYYLNYFTIHKVIKSSRLYVASLERDLKINLNQNHEYFTSDQWDQVKKFIRNYKDIWIV